MDFSFADLDECNLRLVREFYQNWKPTTWSQYVIVRGMNVPISPASINDILGTVEDAYPTMLTGMNRRPPYQAIWHLLCGPQSMAQQNKHNSFRYHKYSPYVHIHWELQVWLKVLMNCLISGLHYTYITRVWVCLVYAQMTGMEINIRLLSNQQCRRLEFTRATYMHLGGSFQRCVIL